LVSPERVLEDYFKRPVETINLIQNAILDNGVAKNPDVLNVLAPLIGLLLRGRSE